MKYFFLILTAIFIQITNAQPVIEWQNTIGGSGEDELRGIEQTTDGGYILAGQSKSPISGDKTEDNLQSLTWDYWVVKFDNSGLFEWDKNIGGNLDDELTTIQQTSDGGYILGGHSFSSSFGKELSVNSCFSQYSCITCPSVLNDIRLTFKH